MNKELLKIASQNLSPGKVDICTSNLFVSEDFNTNNGDEFELQTFNAASKIQVDELESNEISKNKTDFFIYTFFYDVGIRGVVTNENEDTKNSESSSGEYKENDNLDIAFEIKSLYKIKYRSPQKLDEECILEFAKYNVGYNIWPFWREYVQNSCNRMGLKVIEVPFYQFQSK